MQPVLLLAIALTACVVDAGDDVMDVEISASDPDGKADAIDGKRLRIQTDARLSPWSPVEEGGEAVDLTKWKSVSVDGSASTVIATGTMFAFQGTDQRKRLEHSPWFFDGKLALTVEKPAGAQHRLGFLLRDLVYSRAPYICVRGGLRLNYFESVSIDLKSREVVANGEHTFTFAECGIDPDGKKHMATSGPDMTSPTWEFEVFVLPLATTGRLAGAYEYRLGAQIM
jgi:hypothetical protein